MGEVELEQFGFLDDLSTETVPPVRTLRLGTE